jgi:CheY-like chemotaxis protein
LSKLFDECFCIENRLFEPFEDKKMDESRRPILSIGVVAEILSVSVQTLRLWETKGLISPSRKGKDRYYSEEDLNRLKYIKHLLHEKKLNTYGVREVLLKEGWALNDPIEDKTEQDDSELDAHAEAGLGKTILVVDDDPDHSSILKTVLERNGFHVVTAISGREGLAKIETASPDLVILDIMIPDVDGIEICKGIKGNPVTSALPVFIMTSMPENIRTKFGISELPGDAFAQKPIQPSEVIREIKRLLAL